jgi:CRP/FNR family cyclic AMP-dependent transcriptional regulator
MAAERPSLALVDDSGMHLSAVRTYLIRPVRLGSTGMAFNDSAAGPRASVLDADPELARWLTPGEMVAARRDTVVPVVMVNFGAWQPEPPRACGWRHLGYLVLEGILVREEELAGSTSTELVGPGEVLQPWTEDSEDALVPHRVTWTLLEPARLGVLGPAFVASLTRWPVVSAALLARAVRRSSRAATLHGICQLRRVDMRLLALFWHLAERWGRVGTDGVVLPLRSAPRVARPAHRREASDGHARTPAPRGARARPAPRGRYVESPEHAARRAVQPSPGSRRLLTFISNVSG